jgi:protein-S-isoprenylcysteine O-methyltransferase Ste14
LTLRNLLPGALWLGFALGSGTAFLRNGSLLSLTMAAVNLLIAALFILRRPEVSSQASKPGAAASLPLAPESAATPGLMASVLAWTGTFLPFLLRPDGTHPPLALAFQLLGVIGIVLSLSALGRCFGLSPARRGVVTHGLYGWVRHPLYAAELLYFLGVVIAAPLPSNLLVWAALLLIQLRRAQNEERWLAADDAYRDYLGAVCYRFVPGVL